MQDLRYCVSCRQRWQPGAKSCPLCGFVPPDLTPVDPPSSDLKWLWRLLFWFGVAVIPIAIFDTGTMVLRDMTSHGGYRVSVQRERDQESIRLSAVGSPALLFFAFVVSIIRVARNEESAVWPLILTFCMLLFSGFLMLGALVVPT